MKGLLAALQWFFILYFAIGGLGHAALNLVAIPRLRRRISLRRLEDLPPAHPALQRGISLLLAARDERETVVADVEALLRLDYPELEVVVVDDGSSDGTLAALVAAFELEAFPEAHWRRLPARPVRTIYHSRRYPNLRVVDKEPGGRSDALNVGINASRYPLFCAVDRERVLHRDALLRLAEPFADDPATIVSCGGVRVANGCRFEGEALAEIALPRRMLPLFQIVENLRSTLFERLGWASALPSAADAVTLFRKDVAVEAGGYRAGSIGGDTELVLRLHRVLRGRGERYSMHWAAAPVAWVHAPGHMDAVMERHAEDQRALAESLHLNLGLPRSGGDGGAPGWVAFPFVLAFECYGPLVEMAAYAFMAAMWLGGQISGVALAAFVFMALSLGLLHSMTGLLAEEASLRLYPRFPQAMVLLAAAVVENVGYRQVVSAWKLVGLVRWMRFGGR